MFTGSNVCTHEASPTFARGHRRTTPDDHVLVLVQVRGRQSVGGVPSRACRIHLLFGEHGFKHDAALLLNKPANSFIGVSAPTLG